MRRSVLSVLPILLASHAVAQQDAKQILDIEKAMELSVRHSFAARIASSTVEETEARESQTRAALGPRVDLEGTAAWLSKDVNKTVGQSIGTTKVPSEVKTGALVLAQPLTGFGALLLKVKADALSTQLARFDETIAKKDARFSGAESFLRAEKARQLVAVAESSLAVVDQQRRDANALYRAGKLGQSDVLRIELAYADAKAMATQAQSARDVAFAALSETLGIQDLSQYEIKPITESIWERRKQGAPELDEALKEAKNKRPELNAATSRVEIADYYRQANYLDYAPSINLFAKYERDFEAEDINIPTMRIHYAKKDVQDKLTYGLNLKWNLWDWGSRYRRGTEFTAMVSKAKLGQEATESRVRMEVTQAVVEFRSSTENLEAAKNLLKFAEEVYRLTELKFKGGTVSTTDLTSAERDQTRARGNLANARADVDLAWLKLQRAMGKELSTQ